VPSFLSTMKIPGEQTSREPFVMFYAIAKLDCLLEISLGEGEPALWRCSQSPTRSKGIEVETPFSSSRSDISRTLIPGMNSISKLVLVISPYRMPETVINKRSSENIGGKRLNAADCHSDWDFETFIL